MEKDQKHYYCTPLDESPEVLYLNGSIKPIKNSSMTLTSRWKKLLKNMIFKHIKKLIKKLNESRIIMLK
ncbi:MAG: hypothetical protein AAGJ08_02830 [Cyanobacteria bacterium P01_H01_bin.35]